MRKKYTSIGDILHDTTDTRFMSESNMQTLGSAIASNVVYHGKYFITSETNKPFSNKRYTIRYIDDNGEIQTLGEYQQYDTLEQAHKAACNIGPNDVTAMFRSWLFKQDKSFLVLLWLHCQDCTQEDLKFLFYDNFLASGTSYSKSYYSVFNNWIGSMLDDIEWIELLEEIKTGKATYYHEDRVSDHYCGYANYETYSLTRVFFYDERLLARFKNLATDYNFLRHGIYDIINPIASSHWNVYARNITFDLAMHVSMQLLDLKEIMTFLKES